MYKKFDWITSYLLLTRGPEYSGPDVFIVNMSA